MPASQQDKLITAKEVAELTGLSVGAVYHGEAETAELLRIRLGRSVRFSYQDVCAWIERKKRDSKDKTEEVGRTPIRLKLIKNPLLNKQTIDRICKKQ